MNLLNYAKQELALLNKSGDEMQNQMDAHICHMIEEFAEEGHSGFSAEYAISILEKLLRYRPLTPLTGEDDEWRDTFGDIKQNIRFSEVFKHADGQAYWSKGKIFSDDGGESWYTCKDSWVPITFPFYPPNEPERVFVEKEEE